MDNMEKEEANYLDDEPLFDVDSKLSYLEKPVARLRTEEIDLLSKDLELQKDRQEKDFSKFSRGTGFLGICLFIYAIIIIFDIIFERQITEFTSNFVELLKTLILTLVGYLFAKRENI